MGAWRTISVALAANTSAYSAGMAKAGGDTQKFGKDVDQAQHKIDELDKKLGQKREQLGLVVGGATLAGLGFATKAASDLREAQAAANAVFGDATSVIDDYAKNAAQSIGLSRKAAYEATSTFGNLFTQLGVGKAEAADLSTSLVTLGTDFASFFNEDPTRVIEAQTAAFRGEYDALQKYVPTINAAAVEQRALTETGKDNADQLTQQEKALATYNLMLDGAGSAVGDFQRSSGSLATELKKTRAEAENTSASIGEALLPVTAKIAETVGTAAQAFGKLPAPLQTGIVGLGGMTLAVGLLAPKLRDGVDMLKLAGSKSISFGRDLIVPTDAVEGLGQANTRTTGTLGKFAGALGLAVAGLEAYNITYGALEARAKSDVDISALAEDLAVIGKGASDTQPILDQYGGTTEELAGKIRTLADAFQNSGWENLTEGSNTAYGNTHKLKNELGDLDTALADLAKSSPEQAKAAFDALTSSMLGQGVTADDLTAVFPDYYDALERAGRANRAGAGASKDAADAVDEHTDAVGRFLANASQYNAAQKAIADADEAVNDAVIGVADANQRVADAEDQVADATDGVADANQAVADARGRVADAEEQVATARGRVADAERGVVDAQKDAARAAEEVADATAAVAQAQADARIDSEYMADALQGVKDAQDALTRSQEASRVAQEALDKATADYSQTLAGLQRDAAGAADDVLSAEIRLRDAQRRLAELGQDGTPVTADERLAAEIAIREAQRRLEEAKIAAAQAQADYQRNAENGAEGSDAVVEAHQRVEDAANDEAEANRNLEGAVQNVADTQVEANRRIEDAQRTLAEKIDARIAADQRVIDARQAVVDANRDVAKAVEAVRDANRDVAARIDDVREAQQKVTDAKDAVVTARDGVRQAERDVEQAVKDQYKAYQDMAELWRPGSPARERMEWLTAQLREQYSYLTQPVSLPFGDIWGGGKAVPGGKAGRSGFGSYRPGATPTGRAATDSGTYAGVPTMAPNWAQPNPFGATSLNPRARVDLGGIQVDARGIESPAAVATAISTELDWELNLLAVDLPGVG